jgi:tetratricopeptide (TPR) repeat protein
MKRWNRGELFWTWLLVVSLIGVVAASTLRAAMPAEESRRVLEKGLDHFYNLEYDEAIAQFERLRDDDPANAAWQNQVALGYFYKHLLQGGALEGDLFDASNRFFKTKKFPVDPTLDGPFHEANRRAVEICEGNLKKDPRDGEALYACGVAFAARATHQGLIERSALSFLGNARKANDFHIRLVRAHPRQYDGYLVPGLFDFVLGSLPGPVKVLFFFAGLTGNKERGMGLVKNVSEWGIGSKHDARILLTVMYRREKQYAEARRMLEQLQETFPRNYIFPLEIASLYRAADDLPEAIGAYEQVLKEIQAGAPNFSEAPEGRIHFELGVLYERVDDKQMARRHYEQVSGSRGTTPELNKESAANLARLQAGEP